MWVDRELQYFSRLTNRNEEISKMFWVGWMEIFERVSPLCRARARHGVCAGGVYEGRTSRWTTVRRVLRRS